MRLPFVLCLALLGIVSAYAQQSVTFRMTSLPPYHQNGDAVYLAGSFNNWNPGQQQMKFDYSGGVYSLTLSLQKGKYEYKVTRGGWDKVEAGAEGASVGNRSLEVTSDTVINLAVPHWQDHYSQKKASTANEHVKVIDTAIYIPQLNRYRRIWIYLPEGYADSKKKYPVLYMHDGQNVFDAATSFSGEWGVDEALDTLGPKEGACIVVGIDNGGDKRINEYAPFDMERFGKGEGDAYVDFLVKTLQPYINKHYRTKKCWKHQYTAGSSMGGLISFYAILKYPKKFGGAGVFSPAFWVNPQLNAVIPSKAKKVKGKIYFYAGKSESESMVPDMLRVFDAVRRHSKAKMTSVIRTEGKHNEATWRAEFPLFYKWLFGSGR